jgi:PhnB protein
MPEELKDNVMHAEFKADGNFTLSNNILLNLQLDSIDEQNTLFEKLSQNGSVTMPLQQTFFGAHFGMLTDQFGI